MSRVKADMYSIITGACSMGGGPEKGKSTGKDAREKRENFNCRKKLVSDLDIGGGFSQGGQVKKKIVFFCKNAFYEGFVVVERAI